MITRQSLSALTAAAALIGAVSAQAQTQTPAQVQARARGQTTGAAPAATNPPTTAAGSVTNGAAAPGTTVNPVTVQPQTTPQGRVVSSTDAASITSPNYGADDAANPPRAVSLGNGASAGVQTVTPDPPSGLPASMDPGPKRSEIGVTKVF